MRGPSTVWTIVPAAKHELLGVTRGLDTLTISVYVGLYCRPIRLVGITLLVGPPGFPCLGIDAQILAGSRLDDGKSQVVDLVDLSVGRLDRLDVRDQTLLQCVVGLANTLSQGADLEIGH